MSMDKLKIEVLLAAINKATGPLKAIQIGSSETAKALKATKEQLKALNEEQKHIDGFRAAARGIAIHRQELSKAEEAVRTISQTMKAAAYPTKEMQKAFKEATTEANRLKGNITQLTEKQERLRRELSASGADTHKLASYQRDLKNQMATATGEMNKQAKALEELNRKQKALHAARYAYDKTIGMRNKMAGAGVTTAAAGAAMGLPIALAVKDYASYEDAMLGVARQVDGAKDANGRYTKTYYEMGDAIKAMAQRMPLATTEIAAIIEAGARMGIQGKENLLTYANTTAVMATAFNLPVDQVGEDVAKIAALYKVPIQSISELGDTINYLDDNALSKGGDIIDVMKRIAGTADTVGMKYREAAALGSTFLSLGAKSEVAGSASNAIMTNLAIATMQSKKFHHGLAMLKLDDKAVQLGMTTDATGTILKVMDAIKSLRKEKQLEATVSLFGKEFGDDAAKLASNIGEYRKQLELVNSAKAKGSMQREADTRNQALSAQYIMLKNTVFNLSSELGETLKPALVETMQSVANVLQNIRDWTKANPELTAGLVQAAKYIAVTVSVIGALLIAAAAVLGPLAMLKFSMVTLGIKGLGIVSMIKTIGTTFLWLGRLLLMNPIGLAITAIATAAYLIYKNWEPIKAFFLGIWESLKTGLADAWAWIKDKLDSLKALLPDWIKEKLGIKTTVDVVAKVKELPVNQPGAPKPALSFNKKMAALGIGIAMSGASLAQPVTAPAPPPKSDNLPPIVAKIKELPVNQPGAPKPALSVVKQMAASGIGVATNNSTVASPVIIDNRPPITAPAANVARGSVTNTNTITIHASPGMDEHKLGEVVSRKIEALQRQQATRARSSLTDSE